jgi:nucleoid DNA-binding protein
MRQEASEIIDKLLEIIMKRLITGGNVLIFGFGKWSFKSKYTLRGRNPKTGEYIILDVGGS